jgi:hypothetical protein
MDLSIIATAEELRAATEHFLGRPPKSNAERCADWIDWLRRRAAKLFKDAAAAGRWAVELDPPFQPNGPEEVAALRGFGRSLRPLFPGCQMWLNEEEVSGATGEASGSGRYTIEISWAPERGVPQKAASSASD